MNKAEQAKNEIRAVDELSAGTSVIHNLAPVIKLLLTVLYIIVTVSFGKYDITGLIVMALFPLVGYQLSYISVSECFYKLRMILPLVCAVGIANPFFDKEILFSIGSIGISGGVISMLTLIMKGVFSLMMSFLLVATTPVEDICRALRQLHFPKLLTSLFMLTVRYIGVLLDELATMTTAYHLRAPRQNGIEYKAWGSFLGQLILRSMDRADAIYNSMKIRGFHGEFYYSNAEKASAKTIAIAIFTAMLMIMARFYNISALIGGLFIR